MSCWQAQSWECLCEADWKYSLTNTAVHALSLLMLNPLLIQVGKCHGGSHRFIVSATPGGLPDMEVLHLSSATDRLWNQNETIGSHKKDIWLCLQYVTCLAGLKKRGHGVLWKRTRLPTLSPSSVPACCYSRCEPREALAQIPASVEHYIDVACISPSGSSETFLQIMGNIIDFWKINIFYDFNYFFN